ncbi:MAG TPA: nuclear transport factor 2 family protein [Acidimicrobiia bacterium]
MRSVEEWVEAYRQAWENRDPEAAAALFAEGSTYRDRIFDEPHQGPEGVAAYWAGVTAAQSDVSVRMGRPFVDGRRVAVEFWTNMKVNRDEVTLPGCLLLDFDDDWRCVRLREYWHFEPGRHEPPPEWGT